MAVHHSSNPNRIRNVFLTGIGAGLVLAFLFSALTPDSGVSSKDIDGINQRLDTIERKLATPSPLPQSSASPSSSVTISQINKEPRSYIDQEVTLTGKINSPYQGTGFILVDTDGSFLWIHFKDKLPTSSATVKGKVTELKDQISQWKTETGWPADDSTLTAKLRDEKVFLEATEVR